MPLTPHQWQLFATARRKLLRWWNPPLPSGEPPSKTIVPTEKDRFLKAMAGIFEGLVLAAIRTPKYACEEVADAAIFVSLMRERGYDAVPWIQEIYRPLIMKPDDTKVEAAYALARFNGLLALFREEGTVQ